LSIKRDLGGKLIEFEKYSLIMNTIYDASASLKKGTWFKLICGASFQHLPAIKTLALAYTLAGVDCIDVAADPAVITATKEGIKLAELFRSEAQKRGFLAIGKPLLMVSFNDGEDPHFRKAEFNPNLCPPECDRPCENICPARAINQSGVIENRCYGCGRCVPICPLNLIYTRSYVSTPETIAPLILETGVEAIEIHTQVGHEKDFRRLWDNIKPYTKYLKVLAISCQDDPKLLNYLHFLQELILPLPCELVWQTDGRPMSGDIGKGTTRAAVNLAQKFIQANLPGAIQLAGGTNEHTVAKLKVMGIRNQIAGIAYGSYARSLLNPIIEQLEIMNQPLEKNPALLWQAVTIISPLVQQIKS
jgi:Fe-S-cluster-containing hydrogenase component 2